MGLIPTLLLDSLSQTCVKQCHRVSSREAELTAPSSPDRWSFLAPCSHFYFGTSGTEVICSFNKYLPTYFEFGTVLGVRRVVNIKGEVLVLMGRQQISIQQNKHTHTRKNGYPLQYSYLENSMDRGAWQTAVHGVTKSWTCNIYHKLYICI